MVRSSIYCKQNLRKTLWRTLFVLVGEHWKRKGKSQPPFHLGGELPSESFQVHYIQKSRICLSTLCCAEFNGWDFTYVRGSCERAIHVRKNMRYLTVRDYGFKLMSNFFGSFFFSEAKMGSPVSSYITSKSFYPNNYILRLVCIYFVVYYSWIMQIVELMS